MLYFIKNYGGTVIVSLLICAVLFFVIRKMIRDRKKGKSGCSCGCDGCSYAVTCKNTDKPEDK
ncbi:MAG: FeoB-associated Cys-rich membrane protein [Clostridia bacterium]|nr:FeoB-associated Cys-rich membrane protein [Clostridia bacterium]